MAGKFFYIDVETTGLDYKKNDIIQLAYIIEIDKEIKAKGEFKCQPFNYATVEKAALEINKTNIEELKTYPQPQMIHRNILSLLNKYIDKYNKNDKFVMVGYNVDFDIGFFKEFFKKNNHKYFGAYFDTRYRHALDILAMLPMLNYKGLIKVDNYKLITVAKYFGLEFDAHDALADIEITRQVFNKILGYFKD